MTAADVLDLVVETINAMNVPSPAEGGNTMRAAASPRKSRIPGRQVTVVPGGSRRNRAKIGGNEHEVPLLIMTYYSVNDDVLRTAVNDQSDMADALEAMLHADVLRVEVDTAAPGGVSDDGEIIYSRTMSVWFRKR